ncbi:hypothetical protein O988_09861 [Pseudogymnoascus sp. VKM F-3808]|nr:hypothetical protein O988_09861 [Pseudogymnoascus sp. VKM F-3808]
MPQSQEASDVRGDGEGRERGRSSGTQLSSSSHLDDPTARHRNAQRDRCHRKELGGMDGAVIGGVFGCGEAEKGDPLGGAIMQYGGGGGGQASRDERSRQVRESWEGGATVERDRVSGREWPLL